MKQTQIPIKNVYLMLCYAWETFPELNDFDVTSENFEESGEFFARVLTASFIQVRKRGLLREYSEVMEEGRTFRGKVDFGSTIKRMLAQNGLVACTYDTLSPDSRGNQILKWAFRTLYSFDSLSKTSRDQVHECLIVLQNVADREVTRRDFRGVRYHIGNRHYKFPFALCELLFEMCIPDESSGGRFEIPSLFRDEKVMARLFEGFVRNFFKREQMLFPVVGSETMVWDATGEESALGFLPKMRTDITLESSNGVIIIDTKFYSKMFDDRYGAEKIKSGNLYQLLSYLRTKARKSTTQISGILLYPENGRSTQLEYTIEGFSVSVSSVDLSKPWNDIRARLLGLLDAKNGRSKAG